MKRRLFCAISPQAYKLSVIKCRTFRRACDLLSREHFAAQSARLPLPVAIYTHRSLIRRKLGNVDMRLQENKAVNLSLAAPKVNGVLIKPGETFSFWRLVGKTSEAKGYREGLTISCGKASQGIGGGLCQLTNLIHWMILHTPLTIAERHHHDQLDLFPDYNRQIPFGTGTSIFYNYLDYRVKNTTDATYQLFVYLTDDYLCGELRADRTQRYRYHIKAENEFFSREAGGVYRNGEIYRLTVDPDTGNCVDKQLIQQNHARVAYDTAGLTVVDTK